MTDVKGCVAVKKGRPYYFIVLDYVDGQGERKRPWIKTDILVKGNNKRRANARRDEVVAEYNSQKVDLSKDTLFVDFMTQWLEMSKLNLTIAASTYDGYKGVMNKHILPFFEPLKLRVRDVTPGHIQQYIKHTLSPKVSGNTVRNHLANLSKCLESAVKQNIIAFNPVKRIDRPKKKKFTGAKYYNERQIEQLLDISKGDPLEIVILLTVFYGLRRSEVLGIKWNAIDFENDTMAINHTVVQLSKEYREDSTKNDASNSIVPLTNNIVQRLKWWRTQQEQHKLLQPNDYIDEGYVCTQIDGSLIKPHYVSDHFKLLLAKNNMPPIRFHDLRHSSAGYLKHLGFDLKDIQVWLRHGDISTTMNIYVHLNMDAKRAIAENLSQRFQEFGT